MATSATDLAHASRVQVLNDDSQGWTLSSPQHDPARRHCRGEQSWTQANDDVRTAPGPREQSRPKADFRKRTRQPGRRVRHKVQEPRDWEAIDRLMLRETPPILRKHLPLGVMREGGQ